jgi:hypothetical protein
VPRRVSVADGKGTVWQHHGIVEQHSQPVPSCRGFGVRRITVLLPPIVGAYTARCQPIAHCPGYRGQGRIASRTQRNEMATANFLPEVPKRAFGEDKAGGEAIGLGLQNRNWAGRL